MRSECSDIGVKAGKYYAVNVPLQDGIDDISYENVFKPIMSKVMEMYRPTGNPCSLLVDCVSMMVRGVV